MRGAVRDGEGVLSPHSAPPSSGGMQRQTEREIRGLRDWVWCLAYLITLDAAVGYGLVCNAIVSRRLPLPLPLPPNARVEIEARVIIKTWICAGRAGSKVSQVSP